MGFRDNLKKRIQNIRKEKDENQMPSRWDRALYADAEKGTLEMEGGNQMPSRWDRALYADAENELVEMGESRQGFFTRLRKRFEGWLQRGEQERKEAVVDAARVNLVELQQRAEARERESAEDVRNPIASEQIETKSRRGLVGWLKDSFNEVQREVYRTDLDMMIRKESRSANYLNLSNDSNEDAEIYTREVLAIDKLFEKYKKDLANCFSQEEIAGLYLKFQERAKLWDKVRREGSDFKVGEISQLRNLETCFGVNSAESTHYLDELEVNLTVKQRVRALADKKISLDINAGSEKVGSGEVKFKEVRSVTREKVLFSRWDSDQYRPEMEKLVAAGEQDRKPLSQYLNKIEVKNEQASVNVGRNIERTSVNVKISEQKEDRAR